MIVSCNENNYSLPEGSAFSELAVLVQPNYLHRIVLAVAGGKLYELTKPMRDGQKVRFLTLADPIGAAAYRRSVEFLMLKAVRDITNDRLIDVKVAFSMGKGLFCLLQGACVTEDFLSRLKSRMLELVALDLPITKENITTDEAIHLFQGDGMKEKSSLFHYRRVSRVNVYHIDDLKDYFYGYMVPSTGFLNCFDLFAYEDGFVLQMPDHSTPNELPAFNPQPKLYHAQRRSEDWGNLMEVPTVGRLNSRIVDGKILDLILVQEALMEKEIAAAADAIRKNPSKKVVMIAGPSSSGKTTFSHRLSVQLRALGLHPHPIEVDNYFVNRENSPRDAEGNYNFEDIECIDITQFSQDLEKLLAGETVSMPSYNFLTGKREYRGNTLTLGEDDILICEGIHCLNDRLTPGISNDHRFKIYISALTQLNIDEHNRIPTTDGRLIRRIVRDARVRGSSAKNTIRMWPNVRRGEEKNIFPYQESADLIINSALIYELAVLKPYAEPLLFSIGRDEPEYQEAKRLLKFLDYFVGIDSQSVPTNSILREFVGGSCFRV